MKFSYTKHNKILKTLLSLNMSPDSFVISDFNEIKTKMFRFPDLEDYLCIMEWEHLIDISKDENENITTIFILPDAYARYHEIKKQNLYSLYTAVIAFCTLCSSIIALFK